MKKPFLYLSMLACLGACKKDNDNGQETPSTTASITVYNATLWTASSPDGVAAEGVTVSLYASAAAYPASPSYTATSNASGEAVFSDPAPGEYFVVAEKEYMHEKISNLLYFTKGVGGFAADSLHQAAPPAQAVPLNPFGAAGNFWYDDLNGDGIIDFNDRMEFPAVKIKVTKDQKVQQKVLIGHLDNRVFIRRNNATELNTALLAAYAAVGRWHETAITLDAVYTDEYDCTQLSAPWCTINTYQILPYDQTVSKYWKDGFLLVSGLGSLIANTELATGMNEVEKKAITGQAKALKAYIYLQLNQYFGSLPVQEWLYLHPDAIRRTQEETESYIESLLTAAKADLQAASLVTHKNKLSVSACNALLARLSLQQKKYQKAFDLSAGIILDYNLSLDNGNNMFTQTTSPEIIWSSATQLFNNDAKKVFTKGTFLPELRFAEILLINSEASVELGLPENARNGINPLRSRAGLTDITSGDIAVLRGAVQEEWKREMAREGMRFGSLVRWNTTMTVLGPLGFSAYNRYLPIPLAVLAWNFNLMQNAGYN